MILHDQLVRAPTDKNSSKRLGLLNKAIYQESFINSRPILISRPLLDKAFSEINIFLFKAYSDINASTQAYSAFYSSSLLSVLLFDQSDQLVASCQRDGRGGEQDLKGLGWREEG